MNRVFNKEAYNKFDRACKEAAVNYLEKKGFYLVSDLDVEYFKKFDVEMINGQGMVIKIENEFRGKFEIIKDKFKSFHIPIRKKFTECDFYFIWGPDYNEIAVIKKEVIIKYRDNPKLSVCAKDKPYSWQEEFIDIPIQEIIFRNINDF